MASRKSGHYMSENYVGGRRGRERDGDMGWEMFSDRTEITPVYEDPAEMYDYRRGVLKDLTPDRSNLMAHEETRRNTYAKDRLNLRSGGARVTTDPWANEGFDTQFHDADPRGWSTEQPWSEYRRLLEAVLNRTDYKDDGDYSVPSAGLHPNTMYKQIRDAQNWVKARLKIFSTSKDNWHNGGVAQFKWWDKSNAEKVDFEETSVNIDQRYDSYENRRNKTDILSDKVHLGSKMLRVNTTTDHQVMVSAYGKLGKNNGLLKHETQLRMLEDDTQWGKIFRETNNTRPIAKLMSSVVGEGENGTRTAAESVREAMQAAVGDAGKFKSPIDSNEANTKSGRLTQELVSLMGITENEIKFLESEKNKGGKTAAKSLAQLHDLVEMLHAIPANMKLAMRDEIIMAKVGRGIRAPGDLRPSQDAVILNPKIVEFMIQATKKSGSRADTNPEDALREAIADPEGKLQHLLSNNPLYVRKSALVEDTDLNQNRRQGEKTPGRVTATTETEVQSFKAFAREAFKLAASQRKSVNVQEFADSVKALMGMNQKKMETIKHAGDVNTTQVDNKFGENKALTRHIGRIGTKHMQRAMATDTMTDEISDATTVMRRNPTSESMLKF